MAASKTMTMTEAVSLLAPGSRTLALGGNSIHRVPHAFVHRVAQRTDLRLHLVKTAGAYDIDVLCLAGIVEAVSAGFVGYETEFGLARHYRSAVESGRTEAREHACYTVIASLRAAAYGLPFLPVRALYNSDLPRARGFEWLDDPYGGTERFPAIPAIRPDLAVIHVQHADLHGNGVITGPKNEDLLMARAARHVVLTAEEIVDTDALPVPLDHVDIPSVLVDGVVHAPGGARPGSCAGSYDADADAIRAVQALSSAAELRDYLTAQGGPA
tara:strand:+ start:409 stop:1221 length:813 start_codon:yes stop_codon:yes gene_type:complete